MFFHILVIFYCGIKFNFIKYLTFVAEGGLCMTLHDIQVVNVIGDCTLKRYLNFNHEIHVLDCLNLIEKIANILYSIDSEINYFLTLRLVFFNC